MITPRTFVIIEDNIMMYMDSVQLGGGSDTVISYPASPGKAYRLEIQQEVGYPSVLGDSIASSFVEGCNPLANGSFNVGFINQFYNGNSSPFIALDCQQAIASYDPNDKSAQPEGYGSNNAIYDYTVLDYKIRFQNTGTDTAFNIVIRDTLSALLDISTLQMGASSHSYTWQIENNNVLVVTFADIKLVDSLTNEPLSHGFFRYKIGQKAGNLAGQIILNSAAIYFDFNPPIITNTTSHMIDDNFISVNLLVDKVLMPSIEIKVYPNPFKEMTTIEINEAFDELQLDVYDITGRHVVTQRATYSNRLFLSKGNLNNGIYIYQLRGNQKLIGTGKIVVLRD